MAHKIIVALLLVLAIGCTNTYSTKKTTPTEPDLAAQEEAIKSRNMLKRTSWVPELVQHLKGSAFGPTKTGYYTAEFVIKPKAPVVGDATAFIIIHKYNAVDLEGLNITAEFVHADSGESSPGTPTIVDSGRGLYNASNIRFHRAGKWEVRLTIVGAAMTDTVTLELPEVTE